MPSTYTHYRFGTRVLAEVSPELRDLLQRNRMLFDLGLQGPDFFFYYKLGKKTPIRRLAKVYHRETGKAVFTRMCEEVKNPTEEEISYLYGLLGHYCLDSVCHPLVLQVTGEDGLAHNAMESEFERYLLAKDGIKHPHRNLRGAYLRCGRKKSRVIARFYPEAEAKQIREGLLTMAVVLDLLTVHGGARLVLKAMGGANPGLLMMKQPDEAWRDWNEPLEACWEEAAGLYPMLSEALHRHLTAGEPLEAGFDKIFG